MRTLLPEITRAEFQIRISADYRHSAVARVDATCLSMPRNVIDHTCLNERFFSPVGALLQPVWGLLIEEARR